MRRLEGKDKANKAGPPDIWSEVEKAIAEATRLKKKDVNDRRLDEVVAGSET